MDNTAIKHMVIFTLKHEKGSTEENKFLKDAEKILSSIPAVKNFKVMIQISKKNDFDFGFSMDFADQKEYDEYNNHPEHVSFVKDRWLKEVDDFQEIDFKLLSGGKNEKEI